jgi:serine phosphatase RsbU (regulator of sigma subunit)
MVSQPEETYCTLICGVLDPQGQYGHVVRAGHPQPVLVRDEGVTEAMLSGGFPLGWFAGQGFVAEPLEVPDDAILLVYSDGLTDLVDIDGVPLELSGLQRLLQEGGSNNPVEKIASLESQLRRLQPRGGFEDDVSVLALRRKA